ncbi:MAG: hypothetical protein DRJ42_28555, partial [Deltaproteobacteria bacterium]
MLRRLFAATALVSTLLITTGAHAEERWLLRANGALTLPVSAPQTELFGAGGAVSLEVDRSLAPFVTAGARVRLGFLSDAGSPSAPGFADPGAAGLLDLGIVVRGRLPFFGTADQRSPGPWVEVSGDMVVTGDNVRGGLGAGAGWTFDLGVVGVGPAVHWLHTFQPGDQLDGSDADLLFFGVDGVFFDESHVPEQAPPPPPPDTDGDGIVDPEDQCPEEPEDVDGFEDADGCPDPDNDGDGILDVDDACPMEPEDFDEFRDEDGCPEWDNDGDEIVDADDECPNYPEIVNGVDDEDGCPDEGLIQLVNDRIVLEDEIFFGFNQAFIRRRAYRHLEAIIELWRQHPEWESVRIEGHTDGRGNSEYNMRLSQSRAEHVMGSLVERGMPESMLTAQGFGDTRLLTRGDSEGSMQRNRRVEFVVLSRRRVPAGQGAAASADAESATALTSPGDESAATPDASDSAEAPDSG